MGNSQPLLRIPVLNRRSEERKEKLLGLVNDRV
jgi:hypothetical protein